MCLAAGASELAALVLTLFGRTTNNVKLCEKEHMYRVFIIDARCRIEHFWVHNATGQNRLLASGHRPRVHPESTHLASVVAGCRSRHIDQMTTKDLEARVFHLSEMTTTQPSHSDEALFKEAASNMFWINSAPDPQELEDSPDIIERLGNKMRLVSADSLTLDIQEHRVNERYQSLLKLRKLRDERQAELQAQLSNDIVTAFEQQLAILDAPHQSHLAVIQSRLKILAHLEHDCLSGQVSDEAIDAIVSEDSTAFENLKSSALAKQTQTDHLQAASSSTSDAASDNGLVEDNPPTQVETFHSQTVVLSIKARLIAQAPSTSSTNTLNLSDSISAGATTTREYSKVWKGLPIEVKRRWEKKARDIKTDLKKDKGDIEKDKGDIEKDKGDIEKDKGDIEKDKGDIEKDKGDIEKDKGDIEKDKGDIEKDKGDIKKDKISS
ncbi:hypothetical protein BDP27DRAFT_1372731 [Rhodocollybia butyracea]|uniref:Uncharacterized protein n=1 Tax=Rhodocollybia butyracea TaxID=206335 RepID=A0A9P5P7M8_9AGAR|nr:hypothetical protein BDP27DRAFT_1372731 [Rhodocollybia butyracea]